jgi:D-cysteine desulfhydrase
MKIPLKIKLANLPTPLQKISFRGNQFLIKRDDLSGSELSGNKVRKLEYLLYEAKREKADIIFTCGGDQSNHSRATVIAAANVGIRTRLFLWGKPKKIPDGNNFIFNFLGAETVYLNKQQYEDVNEIMFGEKLRLEKKGKRVYVIPEGGSTTLGILGYFDFISELNNQFDLTKINGIVCAAGSGGTAAGILAGISLLNVKLKVYAVNVLYPENVIRKKTLQLAEGCILDFNLNCKIKEENLIVLSGYSTEGYKKISLKKLKLIKEFALETGIILDPAYTGKAFAAYQENFLRKNSGLKNIFIHTGGLMGVFGRRREYLSI